MNATSSTNTPGTTNIPGATNTPGATSRRSATHRRGATHSQSPTRSRSARPAPSTTNAAHTAKTADVRAGGRARTGRGARIKDVRRRALGRYGEDLAARRLADTGMRILDRNWRCQEGEVDIVAADGDAVVMCEVKTRRAGRYEHPMAAVRPEKAARLRRLAERWLERHGGPPPGGVRIDVIGVLLPARGAPVVQHVRGVA